MHAGRKRIFLRYRSQKRPETDRYGLHGYNYFEAMFIVNILLLLALMKSTGLRIIIIIFIIISFYLPTKILTT